ncbi:hypothetical protein [Paraburkholderia terrae]|nr:hypothetical protein [Paraburkholderia terrae]
MRRNLIKSLHSCAAIKGVATILIAALAMVMTGYRVETGTSALRGRLVEMSLWAKYAIAGKVCQSQRTVQHAPGTAAS